MFYYTYVDSNALTLLLGFVVDLLYNLFLQLCRSWQEFDTAELLVISEPSRYSVKTKMKARPHWKFCSRPLSRVLNAISNLWWSSKNLKKIIKKFSRATKASANCISQINAKFLTRKFALQSKSVFGASCIQCNLTAHYLIYYRAMLCISGTSHGSVSVCPSVSDTSRSSTKTAKRRITQTTLPDTPGSLVFWCQRSPRNSTGVTPYEGAECRWGGQNRRLSTYIRLYLENGER